MLPKECHELSVVNALVVLPDIALHHPLNLRVPHPSKNSFFSPDGPAALDAGTLILANPAVYEE